ncbi:hypothetical protein APX01_03045 [Cereibacter sphaeroides]|jgi:hypothetical protein|nr:hypothetical protein APX01_03045 [Cereibacter sphaeroides]ANS33256.1 hypothetical protein A3858_03050 [Cereibacter sphaeroides]ATN62300.1 hypothetical protein A3857_03050 [Cereibacter sphaeroides]
MGEGVRRTDVSDVGRSASRSGIVRARAPCCAPAIVARGLGMRRGLTVRALSAAGQLARPGQAGQPVRPEDQGASHQLKVQRPQGSCDRETAPSARGGSGRTAIGRRRADGVTADRDMAISHERTEADRCTLVAPSPEPRLTRPVRRLSRACRPQRLRMLTGS